ncbi:MAG: winged helix-turn-helix domain-containing protein [Xanthomonadales bacterium]|nr:winged helix-turn-helix domain-containing protein [Xanthomonadales bacterium]
MGEPQNNAETSEIQRFRVGDLLLDVGRREVSRSGKTLNLPGLSFNLLLALAKKAPDSVSVDTLMDEVWTGKVVNPDTVTKRVEMVREALGDDSQNPRYIALVRGHGYRLLLPRRPATAGADQANAIGRGVGVVAAVLVLAGLALFAFKPEPPPAGVVSSERPSVAVLPFANRSADDADSFFVDGVHDDLLTSISRIGSIKTISRTSVLQYRSTTKTIPQIGRELGVGHILEGGVQRSGEQVRINVQLIDAATDEHVWAQTFDRRLTAANVFSIQSDIAEKVAAALATALTEEERTRLQRLPTSDMAALEAYFLGRQNLETRDGQRLFAAKGYFEEAVERDPEFALGYVGLADAYRLINSYTGKITIEEFESNSLSAANRALALDPSLGEAHTSIANVLKSRGDNAAAENAYLRALALSPNYAPAYQWYGEFLAWQYRFDEAVEISRRAVELDPRSPILLVDFGETLHFAGRLDEAMAYYARALELNPEFAVAYTRMGMLHHVSRGRLDRAVFDLRKAMELGADVRSRLGVYYLELQDLEQARTWIEQGYEQGPDGWYSSWAMSWLGIATDQPELARKYAQRTLDDAPEFWRPLAILRDHYLETGQVQEARRMYQEAHPSLLNGDARVDFDNFEVAVGAALVLSRNGEQNLADSLLRQSLEVFQSAPRLGHRGYKVFDVQAYAQLGQPDKALDALEQAIDQGWRSNWWYFLRHDGALQSIRELPRFQALVAEVEADVTAQRSNLLVLESDAEGA